MRDDTLLALIIVVAPLSLLAIGGAGSIYAPLQHQAVDVRGWISGRDFVELFAIARVTPGPGSMLATLIGWRVAGLAGALVATLALYVPCSVACCVVARTWNRYRGTSWHTAIENGLRPIASGLLIAGGLTVLRLSETNWLAWLVAGASVALLLWRPRLQPLWLLAAGAAVFVAVQGLGG
jgi:chromate transporter